MVLPLPQPETTKSVYNTMTDCWFWRALQRSGQPQHWLRSGLNKSLNSTTRSTTQMATTGFATRALPLTNWSGLRLIVYKSHFLSMGIISDQWFEVAFMIMIRTCYMVYSPEWLVYSFILIHSPLHPLATKERRFWSWGTACKEDQDWAIQHSEPRTHLKLAETVTWFVLGKPVSKTSNKLSMWPHEIIMNNFPNFPTYPGLLGSEAALADQQHMRPGVWWWIWWGDIPCLQIQKPVFCWTRDASLFLISQLVTS